jgi:hypothetical protein
MQRKLTEEMIFRPCILEVAGSHQDWNTEYQDIVCGFP